MPSFSVILPVYFNDSLSFFRQAVESLTSQSVLPDEIIIVVDGKIKKDLHEYLDKLKMSQRFNIFFLDKNCGPGLSRDFGINKSKNEIIALMDSDDISINNRFELQLKTILKQDCDAVGGLIEEFNDNIGDALSIRYVPEQHKDIFSFGKWRMPVNNVTLMFKKKAYILSGGYKNQPSNEDWSLVARMLVSGSKFYNLQKKLVFVRAGKRIIKKRTELRSTFWSIKDFFMMYRIGYMSLIIMIINIIIRLTFSLLPTTLVGYFYKISLRKYKNI